jgi:plastocyanin
MLQTVRARDVIALGFVAAALAVGTAACGDDDQGSAGGGQTTTEQTTTVEETTTSEDTTTSEETTTSEDDGSATGALEGETGPGFEIEVRQDGADVERLSPGTYTLSVEDKSGSHNFHLIGPGVDEEVTDVPFVGEKSVTVTLQAGTYTYQCDPHASQGMKGTFTVS